jgi:hypothetical protein
MLNAVKRANGLAYYCVALAAKKPLDPDFSDNRIQHFIVIFFKFTWACILKPIPAVIYGFCYELVCLPLNTRLGWKGLPKTNTLAYYRNCKLWP